MKHLMAQYKYTCYSNTTITTILIKFAALKFMGQKLTSIVSSDQHQQPFLDSQRARSWKTTKIATFTLSWEIPSIRNEDAPSRFFEGTGSWDGGVLMARPFLILFNASSSPMLCRLSILVSQRNTNVIYFLQIRSISNSEPNGHGIFFSCVSIAVWRCSKTICGNDKQGWSLHWERLQRISVIQALEFFQGWQYE